MIQKLKILVLLQLVLQVIILKNEYKVLATTCSPGFVPYEGGCDVCGLSYYLPSVRVAENDGRIVGGIEATANSWPAQALIETKSNNINISVFSGVLIRRNAILTTVSALKDDYMFKVYLGAHNLNDTTGVFSTYVRRIFKHPNYDPSSFLFDIAILILVDPAPLGDTIGLACLPPLSFTYPNIGTISWIAGWGITNSSTVSSDRLQNAKIKILDPNSCVENDFRSKRKICAGLLEGGKGPCGTGDSGAPLFVRSNFGGERRFTVAGLFSYSRHLVPISCEFAHSGLRGVYTRVGAFISWINKVLSLDIIAT